MEPPVEPPGACRTAAAANGGAPWPWGWPPGATQRTEPQSHRPRRRPPPPPPGPPPPMSADGQYYNIREVIAAHGAHSPQAAQLLAEMVEARRAAAAEAQGFVPSEVWAKENMMRPFVPKLTEAAQRAPDGRDPTSQTSAARSGTISTGAWGPMFSSRSNRPFISFPPSV